MNAISLEHTERIWLNTYLPGVPADVRPGSRITRRCAKCSWNTGKIP